jgi:uncharacterized oligopeptide transporter (OPT) family protein
MIDYNTITTVSKNFNYEQTIAENQKLKYNNQFLLATGLIVGICLIGIAIYVIQEENNNKFYYTRNQEQKL